MPRQISFDPAAIAEARSAYLWYAERSESSAANFLHELDEAVSAIAATPGRWSPYIEDTRRYVFRRFPFYLVFRERGDVIQIIAVAHGRRRPGYWIAR